MDDGNLIRFKNKRNELTIHQGCIQWGNHVVVPSSLQKSVLSDLNETHWGITRMKGLTRFYPWWPKIDSDIESTVSSCHVSQFMLSAPPTAQIHPWTFPSRPGSRLHVDYAGPISGHTYMVVVDAYIASSQKSSKYT